MTPITSHELFAAAELSLDLGHADFGIALLEHLLDRLPAHVAARCLLGATLLEREQWAEAREQLEHAILVDPLNLAALRGMARADVEMGIAPEQSQYVRWGAALYPYDGEIRRIAGGSVDESSPLALARALSMAGRHEQAVSYYEAACDQASGDGDERAVLDLLLAEALWNTGRTESARPLAEGLADQQPMWVRPKLILADALLERRDDARGVSLLHDAYALDPSLLAAQELLGQHDRYDSYLCRTLELEGPSEELVSQAPTVIRYLLGAEPLPTAAAAADGAQRARAAKSQLGESCPKGSGEAVATRNVVEVSEVTFPSDVEDAPDSERGIPGATPVRLVLSSRSGLSARFGDGGYRELDSRLSQLCEAAGRSTGAECLKVYVDDDSCTQAFGLRSVDPGDPQQVTDLVRGVESRLGSESRHLLSLLIVGGDSIVPFHRLANPADDDDPEVLSDWPYAAREDNALLARFSVGRLPDAEDGEVEALLTQVDHAIAHHDVASAQIGVSSSRWTRPIRRLFGAGSSEYGSVGYSAEIWAEASRSVFEVIGDPGKLQLSPPSTDYDFLTAYERVPALAYFNLHGFRGSPYWYGHGEAEQHDSPLLPVALTPLSVSWSSVEGAVVYSEACYGAEPPGRHPDGSIALNFVSQGALAFVGSTGMSYGTLTPPLSGADLLGRCFWEAILEGRSVGAALLRARAEFIRAAAAEQGYLDGEDQKALMSFVLYGDPALSLHAAPDLPEVDAALEVACPPLACCSRMMDAESLPLPKDVRAKVQRSLPFLQTNGLMAHPLVLCRVDCSGTKCGTQPCGCGAGESAKLPGLIQASQQTIVSKGGRQLRNVVKVTVNADGDVVKVMVSRGGTQTRTGSDRT